MSSLVIAWLSSFVVMATLFAAGKFFQIKRTLEHVPESFQDLIHEEWERARRYCGRHALRVEPHARKFFGAGTSYVRRRHDLFIERVFGRTGVEKGKMTSFFLKHIAEGKEGKRNKRELNKY